MQTILTISLSNAEVQDLDGLCARSGKSRREVVRNALRVHLLRESLRQSQAQLEPLARRAGWLTEEDILKDLAIS